MVRALLCLFCLALPAAAGPPDIRRPDVVRLQMFDAALGDALRQAFNGGDPDTLAILTEALSGPAQTHAPEGEWACRTIKMGNILPIVAYGNFRCRIEALGDGQWRLTKLTGSQRTTGNIQADTPYGGMLYLGVGHVGDVPAVSYADLPRRGQTPVSPNQTHADVGLFEMMGPNRARLLLPLPILESDFNILYFTR
ncbi:MAG: DUF4893 domain-containing protein [Pseudomonadota bacterium]